LAALVEIRRPAFRGRETGSGGRPKRTHPTQLLYDQVS